MSPTESRTRLCWRWPTIASAVLVGADLAAKPAPAAAEEHLLRTRHGLESRQPQGAETLWVHRHCGLDFAVVLCSALLDSRRRAVLRDEVDGPHDAGTRLAAYAGTHKCLSVLPGLASRK